MRTSHFSFASCAAGLALLVAGCAPPEPVTQGGIGFGSADEYRAQREVMLNGARPVGPVPYSTVLPPGPGYGVTDGSTGVISSGPITSGPIGSDYPVAADPATAPAPVDPAVVPNNTGISDENDFAAVASRETIESDRERIERNRAAYVNVEPGALPERTGASGASPIIEYAINAPNRLGESIYNRSGITLSNSEKACAKYDSPAAAQEAFLKAGGPKRDPKNLDPDGDGFACGWDPTPFQRVRG
ncbi:MAG: hypothetical protein N2422_05870 [Rhodobacteraceae bacterium]|nr:hypothetical protein [Paracoccaceae bacterium]